MYGGTEYLAFELYKTDWPHNPELRWHGDGTSKNPGHAKLKDRAYDRYIKLAKTALRVVCGTEG